MNCEGKRKTLLLGENIELLLKLGVSSPGSQRFEILTVCSGLEALELVQKVEPDLVLLDLVMPGLNGDAVCRIMKADERTSSIPVIVLGSREEGDASAQVLAAGADGLIIKPANKELLLATIECCLGIKIRRQARAGVSLTGELILGETEMPTSIHSLSVNGAFAEIGQGEALIGDLLELRFNLPGSGKDIRVKTADVVWLGHLKEEGPFGMGIRFLDVLPESSFLIALYLEPLLQRSIHKDRAFEHDYMKGTACPGNF